MEDILKLAKDGTLFDQVYLNQLKSLSFYCKESNHKTNLDVINSFLNSVKNDEVTSLVKIEFSKTSPWNEIEQTFYFSALSLYFHKLNDYKNSIKYIYKSQDLDQILIKKYNLSVFIFHQLQGQLNAIKVASSKKIVDYNDYFNFLSSILNLEFGKAKVLNIFRDLMFLESLNFFLKNEKFRLKVNLVENNYQGEFLTPFFKLFKDLPYTKPHILFYLPTLENYIN